jgi:acyl carrier protein
MTRDEIFELLQAYLTEEFEVDASDIVPEAHLYKDLELDSIDALDMMAMLEEKTGLAMEEEDLKKIETIQDIIEYIFSKTG